MTQITIPNVATEVEYSVVSASTGPFTVPFPFLDKDDVFGTVTDAVGTVTALVNITDFTFTSVDVPVGQEGNGFEGGEITLGSSIGADGDTTLKIYRSTVIERTANYPNAGPFDVALLNDEQNNNIGIMQEIAADIAATDAEIAANAAAIVSGDAAVTAAVTAAFAAADAVVDANNLSLNGSDTMTGNVVMGGNDVSGAGDISTQTLHINGILASITEFVGTNIAKTYGSVANMVAATDLIVGDTAITQGYHSAGDGGAAVYRIVAAGTGTDDGGKYHDLSGSGFQAKVIHSGAINLKWWGAKGDGSTDDSAAILAAWKVLVNDGDVGELIATDGTYMTREFGSRSSEAAWVAAGLGSISGKVFSGVGLVYFKLIAGENTRLFSQGMVTSKIQNIRFHGNNPTPAWGGALNNPSTPELVYLSGYGMDLENCVAEFSGGDGFYIYGGFGVVSIRGSKSKAWFNWGYGYVIDRCMMVRFTAGWVEQCLLGGIKVTATPISPPAAAADRLFHRDCGIQLENIYWERNSSIPGGYSSSVPIITLEGICGAHLKNIHNSLETGTDYIYLKVNSAAEPAFSGSNNNIIETANQNWVTVIDAGCDNNKIIRNQHPEHQRTFDLTDNGSHNKVVWPRYSNAFTPSENASNKTIYGVNSNWAEGIAGGVSGGMLDGVSDYNSTNAESNYRVIAAPGMATFITPTIYNNHVMPTSQSMYVVLFMKAPSGANISSYIRDAVNSEYYNFAAGTWGADAYYHYYETNEDKLWYIIPFEMDAVANRKLSISVRNNASNTDIELYHCYICDHAQPPIAAIRSSVVVRKGNFINSTTALLPAASKVAVGTTVFDTTLGSLVTSDGTNWV